MTLEERLQMVRDDKQTMETICSHVSNGGSLIDLCEVWQIPYHLHMRWIQDDSGRARQYAQALVARDEWMIQRLLGELKALAFVDVRKIFDENHALLPPDKWPVEVARAVAGIDVVNLPDDGGQLKKVKFYDKLKSIDLLGKQLGMFIQRHELTGKLTLEELVAGSQQNESVSRITDERSQN